MAKTIKITIYNPKELWRMFCNWVFWPRLSKWLVNKCGKLCLLIFDYSFRLGNGCFQVAYFYGKFLSTCPVFFQHVVGVGVE